jgi:hypothetical protein
MVAESIPVFENDLQKPLHDMSENTILADFFIHLVLFKLTKTTCNESNLHYFALACWRCNHFIVDWVFSA